MPELYLEFAIWNKPSMHLCKCTQVHLIKYSLKKWKQIRVDKKVQGVHYSGSSFSMNQKSFENWYPKSEDFWRHAWQEAYSRHQWWWLETVQDFLIKLGIKPLISIFSLNNDLVRLTKIMNNLVKDLKILSFKVIFLCLKLVESFQKKILWRIFD